MYLKYQTCFPFNQRLAKYNYSAEGACTTRLRQVTFAVLCQTWLWLRADKFFFLKSCRWVEAAATDGGQSLARFQIESMWEATFPTRTPRSVAGFNVRPPHLQKKVVVHFRLGMKGIPSVPKPSLFLITRGQVSAVASSPETHTSCLMQLLQTGNNLTVQSINR